MTFTVKFTTSFKKSYKLMIKRGLDISLLDEVVEKLKIEETLDAKYRDHLLLGKYYGFHECHIKPDWLLVYYYNYQTQTLVLVDTGTHSDVLKM